MYGHRKGQVQQVIRQRQRQRAGGGVDGGAVVVGLGHNAGHIAVELGAGGHELIAALLLHILHDGVIYLRVYVVDLYGIGQGGRTALRAGEHAALAQQLQAHHRGKQYHQDQDQQVHNVDLSKQSAFFI